jgi:hypothetical protein
MKLARSTRLVTTLSAAAVALSCVGALPANAERSPLRLRRDVADNGFSINYDAVQGRVVDAASSIVMRAGETDRVDFTMAIGEAGEGSGLAGGFRLRLSSSRAVRYEGDFIMKLKRDGKTVAVRKTHRNVTLRPNPGERLLTVDFRMDAPPKSGNYDLVGKFLADPN